MSDGFDKTKLYVKRGDFDFNIVNFPFVNGDVPRSTSYGVYIFQHIRFARVSSHVDNVQFQLPSLLLFCVLFVLFLLFVVVLSGEPRQKQGRGLVDRELVQS